MRSLQIKPVAEIVRQYAVARDFLTRCEGHGLLSIQQRWSFQGLERRQEERLQVILKGLELGFTLREMKMLFDAFPPTDPPSL